MICPRTSSRLPVRLALDHITGHSLCNNCAVIPLSKSIVGDGPQLPTTKSYHISSRYTSHGISHLCIYWTKTPSFKTCRVERRISALPCLSMQFVRWFLPYVSGSLVPLSSTDLCSGWR